jgi:hypothetical protein
MQEKPVIFQRLRAHSVQYLNQSVARVRGRSARSIVARVETETTIVEVRDQAAGLFAKLSTRSVTDSPS